LLPDGSDPSELIQLWSPWIGECVMFLDGKGTFRHYKYPGSYSQQPFIDIQIYKVIQQKWIQLTNNKMKEDMAIK
jgi:hypothetical protein